MSKSEPTKLSRAVLLFIFLDFTVLAINFWIANEMARDAVSINLAGRQRMLTQRITKSLLQLHAPHSADSNLVIEQELYLAVGLFDQTLTGFELGGTVTGGDGNPVELRRVASGQAVTLVDQALRIWKPINAMLSPYTARDTTIPDDVIASANKQMLHDNLQLLELMNLLTSSMESDSLSRANTLRAVQTVVFFLALLNFFLIVRRLRDQASHAATLGQHFAALATRDSLTGLFNRREFKDALEREYASARRRKGGLALLLMDLDGFKQVNDIHGHEAGDKVLCTVASRISEVARANDTAARIGGDEFVLICPDLSDKSNAATLSQRLIDAINQPIDIGVTRTHVGVSIGIAFCSERLADPEQIIRQADQAMYTAKQSGRNRYIFSAEG